MLRSYFPFIRKFSLYFIVDIVFGILSFLSIPIYSQILNPAEYGTLSLFLTTVSMVSIVFLWGGDKSVFLNNFSNERSSTLLFNSCVATIFISFVLGFSVFFINIISLYDNYSFFLKISLYICALGGAIVNIFLSFLNSRNKVLFYALFKFLNNVSILVFSLLLTYLLPRTIQYEGRIVATTICQFVSISFVFSYIIFREGDGIRQFKKQEFLFSLMYGFPVLVHSFASVIISQSDRLMIKYFLNDTSLGVYSLSYSLGSSFNLIISAGTKVWLPYLFKNLDEKNYDDIEKKAVIYSFAVCFICLLAILIFPLFSRYFINESYENVNEVVSLVLLSYLFLFAYSIYGNYFYYLKKTKFLLINSCIASCVNIVINFLMLSKFGITVAAFSTLISYFVLFFLSYIELRVLRITIPKIMYIGISFIIVVFIYVIIY